VRWRRTLLNNGGAKAARCFQFAFGSGNLQEGPPTAGTAALPIVAHGSGLASGANGGGPAPARYVSVPAQVRSPARALQFPRKRAHTPSSPHRPRSPFRRRGRRTVPENFRGCRRQAREQARRRNSFSDIFGSKWSPWPRPHRWGFSYIRDGQAGPHIKWREPVDYDRTTAPFSLSLDMDRHDSSRWGRLRS
jgi:hypothetical protein